MLVALLCAGFTSAWGGEASFAPSDFSGQGTSGTGSAISATVDGVTFACNKGYGTTQIRCYSGGKITISSSNTITAISFTFSGSYTGGLETSYTGLSTTSWEATLSSQARITAVTVTYKGGSTLDPCNLALNDAPVVLSFDLFNNSAAQTIHYTTSSTGAVTISGGTGYVSTSIDEATKTITVTPNAKTPSAQTITISQAADDNYDAGTATFTVSVDDSTPDPFSWVETSFADLTNNDVFVIVGYNGKNFALTNDKGGSNPPTVEAVNVESGKITSSVGDNIKWSLNGDATSNYIFHPNGSTSTWLYCTNNNNGVRVGINNANKFKFASNGYLYNVSAARYLGIYDSKDWRCYETTTNNIAGQSFKFYKRVNADAPQPPFITASNVDIVYDATSGSIAYTLTNPVDGGVVTANTTANWLTIGTVGETVPFTCTANAAGTERSATVTLTYTYNTNETITKDVTVTQAAAPTIYTTIPDLFAAATSTETAAYVTFNNWVVSGVSSNGKNVYVTDNKGNGFVIYDNNGGLDQEYSVGNILSGTAVPCTLKLYNGYVELLNVDTSDLTITDGGTFSAANIEMAELSGVNTGALVSYENLTCSIDNSKYYLSDGTTTLQVYNSLFAFGALEAGKKYNITGIYQQFNSTKEILPRNAGDIVVIQEPSIGMGTSSIEVPCYETTGTLSVAYNNITDLSSAAVILCDAEGTATTYDWLTVSINNDKNVDYSIQSNLGETRTAYLKVSIGNITSELVAITQSEYVQTTTYTLATSITPGKLYIITNGTDKAMGLQNSNNRAAANATIEDGTAIVAANSGVFEFVIDGNATDGYSIYDEHYTVNDQIVGGYLYAASSSSNHLKTQKENNDNGCWEITIAPDGEASVVAMGEYTHNVMRYNPNNGNPIFSCYEEDKQHPIYLYKKVEETPIAAPAKPIVFHDGGEGVTYEGELTVPMFAEEGATIKYTVNGGDEQTYSTPVELSTGETTITAWAELNGVASDVVEKTFTIIEKAKGPSVTEKYYTISNNDKYVNVAGRRTVTFVGESTTTTAAGTVIKVKATDGEVEVLRSQAVDIPGYAQRAMVYVPKVVRLVAEKLGAEGEGNLLGKDGLDAIMKKFNESFDYTLHLESAGENAYRIYGRTPSMKPVVDFYAENKANVDAKLPQLEQFINSAIEKILTKTGGRGTSILRPDPDQPAFSLVTVWEKMVVKTPNLTKPEDEASTAKFYEELLSSETNVWNFAYETAMIYWSRLKNNETFLSKKESLGEYAKYIDKIEYIRPNVKYYLVLNKGGLDVFSQDNPLLEGTSEWTLDERTEFKVTVPADNELNGKFYTTFYADFAYTVPDGLKAYTIKEVKEGYCYDYAVKKEISGVIPAQTPVLLEADAAGEQTLTLKPEDTSAAIENELKGPDYLIEAGQIKAAQVENLFDMALGILGQEGYDNYLKEYEYLMLRTSGTVNNKYFFGLSKDDCKDVEENVCVLDGTSFNTGWKSSTGALYENKAFLVHESQTMIQLSMAGDVNRDGNVDNEDVNALVNIILGKVTENDNYDMKAADVNCDGNEDITIADVTALVNIILGGSQN